MKESTKLISLFAVAAIGLLLISSCSNQNAPEGIPPDLSPTVAPTSTPTRQGSGGGGIIVPGVSGLATAFPTIVELVPTRTPAPTATPDAISEAISKLVQRGGVSEKTLLWLKYADWVNLGISLFYVFVGYLIGTWLIRWLFPRIVRRTKTKLDDRLLQVSGNQVRWLAVVMAFRSSIGRLTFVSAGIKTFITDIAFFLSLFLIIGILWHLIDLAAQEAEMMASKSGQHREAESLITLSVWALRFLVLIFLITFTLGHFAVDITGVTLFLGIIILVLSIASRDLLADLISGALILVDRPYRVGDRIKISEIDTWGDVVAIGMRSTKVLTLRNLTVSIPNSVIGKNQVVNYSYPDPSYFDTTDIGVAYENDIEKVEQLLENAVGSVDGVQKERGIFVRLESFTRDQMIFRVGWWMENIDDYYTLRMLVNRAIVKGLKEAGVILPYQKGSFINPVSDTKISKDVSE